MNYIDTLIYIIGRELRSIRILYWKLSGGRYLWGIALACYDLSSNWLPRNN
jgi:hypothetical protein